jgi:hypothetical protein
MKISVVTTKGFFTFTILRGFLTLLSATISEIEILLMVKINSYLNMDTEVLPVLIALL